MVSFSCIKGGEPEKGYHTGSYGQLIEMKDKLQFSTVLLE